MTTTLKDLVQQPGGMPVSNLLVRCTGTGKLKSGTIQSGDRAGQPWSKMSPTERGRNIKP